MNSTKIEVPLTLSPPHFEDERTIANARQVKPIGRAKVTESWRTVRTLLPLILLATSCGAIGAAGVNYYDNRHKVNTIAQPAAVNNSAGEVKTEASQIAVAASASPTPGVSDKNNEPISGEVKPDSAPIGETQTKAVTATAADERSDKPAPSGEKKATDNDAAKLTRKRRVNPSDEGAIPANKRGAGHITDIFSGPNP